MTRDIVKFEVYPQTRDSSIQNCDGLCTRTDYHMLLPIVLYMIVPLYLKMQLNYIEVVFCSNKRQISIYGQLIKSMYTTLRTSYLH